MSGYMVEFWTHDPRLFNILPEDVARKESAWRKRHALLRAVKHAEQRQVDMAKLLGVTKSRVGQMLIEAETEFLEGHRSPMERYCDPLAIETAEPHRIYRAAQKYRRGMPGYVARLRVQSLCKALGEVSA